MKALVFDKELKLSKNEPLPVVPKGEALIRVLIAGICNTDLEITKGYMDFTGIPGHEFVGVVEEINDTDQKLLGKRVVGDINCACGVCEYCKTDMGRHCPNRTTLGIQGRNGCFAEYISLPVVNLVEVPSSIPDQLAVFTEPLAAGFEILEQLKISSNQEVLIVGDGRLGLLINHALSTTGAKITHTGKYADKLKLIKDNNCQTILIDKLPDKKYDIVVEATGSISGFEFSLKHTKPRGTLVLKSTLASNQQFDMNSVVINEITIVGSRCGLFQPALDYLATGVDLSQMVTAIYPIEKGLEAFQTAKTKEALKVLIDFRSK